MKNQFGRKLYTLREIYSITYNAIFSIARFRIVKSKNILSEQFIKRIMLAVTEVNGCEVCSYAHSKAALETGMSNDEIENLLSGINDSIPKEELTGIMFAQHYADSRGKPSKDALKRILKVYGRSKAEGIVAVVRIIMMGNAYGIPWSSFVNRFKGKSDERCSLLYELSTIVSTILFLPPAILQASFANMSKIPFI